MQIDITMTEDDLRKMIFNWFVLQLGQAADKLKPEQIKIETKSKQNYKSEWEVAAFRARLGEYIP